jgi:hypothetical protein
MSLVAAAALAILIVVLLVCVWLKKYRPGIWKP